ncbi:UNVERIFIED_CONTAM: hypothetical protein FKN15_017959 [Acipenser sinensis]
METSQRAESREFQYPAELRSAQARKHHKLSMLRENPECLYTDYSGTGDKKMRSNLIFYTQHFNAWHTAVCKTYTNVTKRGLCQGRQILLREDSDPDSTVLSINVYHSRTVLIQGSEASLTSFEKKYKQLKEAAEIEKTNTTANDPENTNPEDPEDPTTDSTTPDTNLPTPTTPSDTQHMRECLALLELEFVEFRELTLARLTETSITQQLRDEVSQLKRENRVAITELTSKMKDLQQENANLRTQLTSVKEEMQRREKHTHSMLAKKKTNAEVALLIDINGKYLDMRRLFPSRRVNNICCTNTERALQLLNRDTLGSPSCIVIHTGTNDLGSLRHDTAKAVRRVAERATQQFPDSRVIISTLLPRADTHPHTINAVNAEITRGCAALPNVHLAHHPTVGPWHLYDKVHLNQEGVKVFAKTLKDAVPPGSTTTSSKSAMLQLCPSPAPTELGEIKQLLSIICSRLLN